MKQKHQPQSDTSQGFTLVELLVVIAILAILISILIPTIHRGIFLSKHTDCVSRKHQLLIAMNTYVADHDGYYPLRWQDGRRVYWHPYWWGRTDNASLDMHEEIEEYFASSGTTPDLLLCAATPDSMWGVPKSEQWPLGRIYRTSVAVYAGWNWRYTVNSAAVPLVPRAAVPIRAVEANSTYPLLGDVIEYTTGVSGSFTGWVTNHAADKRYHLRSPSGPEEIPEDGIPFGYADGSVIVTRDLTPLYKDRGWAVRYWAERPPSAP